jgi:hypothetical protein
MSPSPGNASIVARLERSHHFFDEGAPILVNPRHPRARMGVSITYPSKFGMQINYDRRHCGPRSRFVQSHQEIFNGEGFGNSQEGLVEICKDVRSGPSRVSLAGRLRTFQRKPFTFRGDQEIHSRPGRASQKGNVSGGVSAHSKKIRRAVRRTIFMGLNLWIALPGQINPYGHFPSEGVALGYDG